MVTPGVFGYLFLLSLAAFAAGSACSPASKVARNRLGWAALALLAAAFTPGVYLDTCGSAGENALLLRVAAAGAIETHYGPSYYLRLVEGVGRCSGESGLAAVSGERGGTDTGNGWASPLPGAGYFFWNSIHPSPSQE